MWSASGKEMLERHGQLELGREVAKALIERMRKLELVERLRGDRLTQVSGLNPSLPNSSSAGVHGLPFALVVSGVAE